jgi:hypothetical protein
MSSEPNLSLTRDTVIRAYNIVAFAAGVPQHYSWVPPDSLNVAKAVVELYRTPTPFRQQPRRTVKLPPAGLNTRPTTRRPSFERNIVLGYPSEWS